MQAEDALETRSIIVPPTIDRAALNESFFGSPSSSFYCQAAANQLVSDSQCVDNFTPTPVHNVALHDSDEDVCTPTYFSDIDESNACPPTLHVVTDEDVSPRSVASNEASPTYLADYAPT